MKKHILSILFLGLATSFCYSQVKISVQAGAGLNGITKAEPYEADFGYRFGVGVELPLAPTWSLQMGLQLLNRRSTVDGVRAEKRQYEGEDFLLYREREAEMNAIYLQLPIKIAKYVPLNKNCGLQISAGPYLAYGVGGENEGEFKNTPIWSGQNFTPQEVQDLAMHHSFSSKTFDKDSGLKRIDIGLSAGVDLNYKSFFVGAGVEYGLLPISKNIPKDIYEYIHGQDMPTTSPHNFGAELHVGYRFKLGR